MATIRICDQCRGELTGLVITVTEKSNGEVGELCSVQCYADWCAAHGGA